MSLDTGKTIEEVVQEDQNIRIKDLEGHAEVANREMAEVKNHLGIIETDVAWIKKQMEKLDNRVWVIISTIILGIIIQIFLKK